MLKKFKKKNVSDKQLNNYNSIKQNKYTYKYENFNKSSHPFDCLNNDIALGGGLDSMPIALYTCWNEVLTLVQVNKSSVAQKGCKC